MGSKPKVFIRRGVDEMPLEVTKSRIDRVRTAVSRSEHRISANRLRFPKEHGADNLR